MRLLLDTVAFLWATLDDPRLSGAARELFQDPGNELFLSAVSAWEISVKYGLGRMPLPEPPGLLVPAWRKAYGIQPLPVEEEAALYVARLPPLHGDPFDRLLICQAIVHGLALLSPDRLVAQYPVRVLW